MPQMSNLWWLPLMIYTSTAMFMITIMMFNSNMNPNKNKMNKNLKKIFKNWTW